MALGCLPGRLTAGDESVDDDLVLDLTDAEQVRLFARPPAVGRSAAWAPRWMSQHVLRRGGRGARRACGHGHEPRAPRTQAGGGGGRRLTSYRRLHGRAGVGPRAADVVRGHGRGVGAGGDHLPRRAGSDARLRRVDRRAGPPMRALRPGWQRALLTRARCRRRLLDGGPLPARARRARGRARAGRIPRDRPVVGRDARDGARAPAPAGAALDRRRRLAGLDPAVGSGGGPAGQELPEDVQATLTHHEEAGTTDAPEYQQAMLVFYARHVCRLPEWPEAVAHSSPRSRRIRRSTAR